MAQRGRPKKKVTIDDHQQQLIDRISECVNVIGEIDTSYTIKIIFRDLEEQRKRLDDKWQEITDPARWNEARVLKMATMHVLELKAKYQEELDNCKLELGKYQNTDKVIPRDYDMETNTEAR
jgi:hypothetical protein